MKYAGVRFAKLASTSSIACSGWLNMWDEFDVCFSLAPRGFSPGTPVFSSPQKPTLPLDL